MTPQTGRSARDEVLGRVRAALSGAGAAPPVERGYRRTPARPQGDPALVDLLAERLVDYRATVTRTDEAGLAAVVLGRLADATSCVVPTDLPAGWTADWVTAGGRLLRDAPGRPVEVAALDAVDAVLTGARVAVAETGTIVLDAGRLCGRRALSLVPDHHVCVVRDEQVVEGVPAALELLEPTRPMTWVSGPSATSDIELQRVEGVHGPRRLDVVLVSSA